MAKIIVIVKGADGEPDMIEMDGLTDETVIVNMIDGKIKVSTKEKPTVCCNVCGEPMDEDDADHNACKVILSASQPMSSSGCGGFGAPVAPLGAYVGQHNPLHVATFAGSLSVSSARAQETAQRLQTFNSTTTGAVKALELAMAEATEFLNAQCDICGPLGITCVDHA